MTRKPTLAGILVAVTLFIPGPTPAQDTSGHAVWTGSKVDLFGRVSPNGRFITFTDWQGFNDLAVHDVKTNADRILTGNKGWDDPAGGEAQWSAVSPDSQQVAYAWVNAKGTEVRIVPMSATSSRQARTLLTFKDDDVGVRDWSPDGKLLALSLGGKDNTNIAVVTVADGMMRVLKSSVLRGPQRMFFSRDSRYLAFDLPAQPDDDQQQRDVFIIRVSDGREIRAVRDSADDVAAGWSPDGARLIFTRTRDDSRSLWAVRVSEGQAKGKPELLHADVGSRISLGVTDAGTVYLHKTVGSRDVKVARIDLSAGSMDRPMQFPRGVLPAAMIPHWSPDGRFLVYQTKGPDEGLAIRSVDTGEVRRMRVGRKVPDPRWSPDGRSLLVGSTDNQGREGIVQIDVQSGRTTLVVRTNAGGGFTRPRWSADGTKIYYVARATSDEVQVREHELRSGAERDILRGHPSLQDQVSPDGRYLAVQMQINPTTLSLFVSPVAAGERRELLRLPAAAGVPNAVGWTPDGRSLFTVRRAGTSIELWLVDANSGNERKLDADVSDWTLAQIDGSLQPPAGAALSPDGRAIAFVTGTSGNEVWALDGLARTVAKH